MALHFILMLRRKSDWDGQLLSFEKAKMRNVHISNLWGWDLGASWGSHLPGLEPLPPLRVWACWSTGLLVYVLGLLPCRAGEINGHIFQVVLRTGFDEDLLGSYPTWTRTFLKVVRAPESSQLFLISWFPYHICRFFMHPFQKRKREKQISLNSAIEYISFMLLFSKSH